MVTAVRIISGPPVSRPHQPMSVRWAATKECGLGWHAGEGSFQRASAL